MIPVLVYIGLAVYLYSPFLAHPSRAVPGGPDGIIYVWYFQWVEQAFVHAHNPLLSVALNAPQGVSTMWNTSILLFAVICIPLTAVFGPFTTVVLVAVFAPIASATTTYYVLRRLTGSTWGAAIGGLLYGYGPFFVGQNGHIHLSLAMFAPVLLLIGRELIVDQVKSPWRTGIWLGIAVGLALLATQEVVALTAVVAVIAVIALIIVAPRQLPLNWRHAAKGLVAGGVVALVIDAIPLYYQFLGPLAIHGVPPSQQRQDLAGLVRPGPTMRFASQADIAANLRYPANMVENTGYLGWALVGVCVVALGWLMWRRQRFPYWWLITVVSTIVLSLGNPMTVDGHRLGTGPWHYLAKLPLMKGAIPVRFSLLTTLLVGLLLATALSTLHRRWLMAGVVVTALALIPLVPSGRYGEAQTSAAPRFFTTSAVNIIRPNSNVVVMPIEQTPAGEATLMTWQIRAHLRFRLIGGYSVFNVGGQMAYIPPAPALYTAIARATADHDVPTAEEVTAAHDSVAAYNISYVVISELQKDATYAAGIAQQLTGCTPQPVADVLVCAVSNR